MPDVVRDNLISGVQLDKLLSLEEAQERYLVKGWRSPKLLRMLRALWRVKDA